MNNFDEELIKKYLSKDKWEDAFQKLADGYPVQYLIGNVEFYGNVIDVDENVLIPRFETEYLVDYLLKLIKEYHFNNPRILDIGTGSGCISIALKKNMDCSITAIDKSNDAIQVANNNAIKNNVDIMFENTSIEDYHSNEKYDVIVSNPPYVRLDEEVDPKTKFEPQEALFASENGLYFYNLILQKSIDLLNKKNIIAFEIGNGQANEIIKRTKEIYPDAKIISKKDLNGFERYIYIINE